MLDLELGHDPIGDVHQVRVLERHEVHRQAGAHRLPRLRVAEDDVPPVGDPVDRALAARGELHHEQVGPAVFRQELDRLLEPHGDRSRTLVEQLMRAVDRRIEDPETARPRPEDRLEADRPVGIAELARRLLDRGSPANPPELRRRHADSVQEGVALGLVVRAPDRLGRRDEHGNLEALARGGQPCEIERGLRQNGVDALVGANLEHGVGEVRLRPSRNKVEGIAEQPTNGPNGHVRSDQANAPLAVLPQRSQKRGRPGRAACGNEHGDGPHERSIVSSASCASRRSRSASSMASIVSRIVPPGWTQISGCVRSWSHSKSPRARASCGHPSRQR